MMAEGAMQGGEPGPQTIDLPITRRPALPQPAHDMRKIVLF